MRIFSWNVNGLRAIISKNFGSFLDEFSPDVLCLQETRLDQELAEQMDLGFEHSYFHCARRRGYSGTAVLSKTAPLGAKAVQLKGHPDEGRILELEFENFFLVNVYVPNSRTDLERLEYREVSWGPDFANYLKTLKKPVVACGDFNVAHEEIDLARPASNHFSAGFTDQERADFTRLLSSVPLVDVWRKLHPDKVQYTWWSYRGGARARNVGWRIDYFLASPDILGKIKECSICDTVGGSDHCPVLLELSDK